ncbi:hypothetical protein EYD10_15124 [Varanus komodoensis]|nr:hypothetical protein EYD10_15124 [Varanus komodoensis]
MYVRRCHVEEGCDLFFPAVEGGTRSNGAKLKEPSFTLDVRKYFLMIFSDSSCKNSSSFSAALLGTVWVFLTGGILLSFFFLIFTIHFRKNRIVKMSSPNLNIVTLLGSGLTYCSAFLFGIEKQNSLTRSSMEILVQARVCLLCIGVTLTFGPILGKSWRLYKVFTQQVPDKRVIIKDFQLLLIVSMFVLVDITLLLAWIFLDPVQCLQSLNVDLKVTEKGLICTVSQGYFCMSLYSDLWHILFLGFKGSLLMYGAYLAGLTDDLSCPPVNQSLTLIVGIVIIFLSTGITLVVNRFFHMWHNLVLGFTSGGIFVCTSAINCLIFIPQVRQWKAFKKADISNMTKYFANSSKNFHSTMYSDEEIYQLLGEKNSMMQQLAKKSLGVLLDPELSLEAQVTAVARSAFLQLRLINQLRPYLEYNCLATVTHALVTSRLDFCNALYVGLPLKTVWILQLVQNRAARLLTGTGRYVHMTPVLRQLHWLPIEVRAQFKVLVTTYKALNGLGPGYLKERLHPYMPGRPLRSAGEALLWEPSVKEIRRVDNGNSHDCCEVVRLMKKLQSELIDVLLANPDFILFVDSSWKRQVRHCRKMDSALGKALGLIQQRFNSRIKNWTVVSSSCCSEAVPLQRKGLGQATGQAYQSHSFGQHLLATPGKESTSASASWSKDEVATARGKPWPGPTAYLERDSRTRTSRTPPPRPHGRCKRGKKGAS